MVAAAAGRQRQQRRLKVFCVTCSFAPDDLFFPLVVTAAIKGTWFLFSFAVCLNLFFQPGCTDGISAALAVSAIGFTCLQLLAFVHKLVLLLTSARGTIREPNHSCVRELLLTGVAIYVVEVVWAVYSVVAVLTRVIDGGTPCERLRRPIAAYVFLVWLNWLELAVLALVYCSCLDRCKCFFCHALCSLHCRQNVTSQALPNSVGDWNVEANIRVLPTSRSISASHLCSIMREKLCTCRRDGLNNSKNVALLDLSHAMEVLFRDMEIHYTALDRLSGWILVQKYHSQLLRQGESSNVTEELLKATLRFLKKKGVIDRFHEIRRPQPLEGANKLPETLLYYFWFAMAAYGWSVKVFLEPLSGTCTLCRGARCSCCVREQQVDEVDGRGGLFLKSAEVASIAGINVEDVVLGKTANDIHCPPFFVCRTARRDKVTGETRKELVITIRGTLSVKDVMTNVTASMRDATKCQESLVEKWFELLVKTKLTFLGVQDAYFHTGFYKSAKVILNILRKSKLFKDLVEKEHYRVVVAGHSLGAGVGAVLTLLIKQKHPHWADGLHAYLYSIPGAVCSKRFCVVAMFHTGTHLFLVAVFTQWG
ncbi:Diacylglycerol lipase-alpha [Geodia barretti]|uniref:sn-1-specific diacylglycerol lipase n=1 Tax=Geodia barretti TaxID=519541 RepID=A0AA35WA98_GEOBA|nr:Diacylglycerol lipase-alpha [Geodia barretti]